MLNNFNPYPFERLRILIKDITPKDSINLTIGEPKFDTPLNIQNALKDATPLLNKYPKSSGEEYLKDAQIGFIKSRFGVDIKHSQIIPTFGTREVLFNFPQFYLNGIKDKTIAFPNPFYQIYEGAALASSAKVIYMDLNKQNNFTPYLKKEDLEKVNLVILNSPNNPTGRALDKEEMKRWIQDALRYDFVLINDECYSEIYEDSAPCGILEASVEVGNIGFKNVLSINSISKRNSAPGLRSGFIAGDEEILKSYGLYRTYLGNALPLPLQNAAKEAWEDSKSAEMFRLKYATNLQLARKILGVEVQPYSFYVWLEVPNGDEESFVKELYEKMGVLVLPGGYLGRDGAGKGYVRIALVESEATTQIALEKIKQFIQSKGKK